MCRPCVCLGRGGAGPDSWQARPPSALRAEPAHRRAPVCLGHSGPTSASAMGMIQSRDSWVSCTPPCQIKAGGGGPQRLPAPSPFPTPPHPPCPAPPRTPSPQQPALPRVPQAAVRYSQTQVGSLNKISGTRARPWAGAGVPALLGAADPQPAQPQPRTSQDLLPDSPAESRRLPGGPRQRCQAAARGAGVLPSPRGVPRFCRGVPLAGAGGSGASLRPV